MLNGFYNTFDVDLATLPDNDLFGTMELSNQVTIGDMHGNGLKFLYFLSFLGVFRNNSDFREFYSNFMQSYAINFHEEEYAPLARLHLSLFELGLKRFSINKSVPFIRIIGDELNDRGQNDWYTLLLIEKLSLSDVKFEILLSNHSIEALACFFKNQPYNNTVLSKLGFGNSSIVLQWYIDQEILLRERVDQIIEEHYLPHLKLLSYSIDKSGVTDKITIFSHALIDIQTIERVAKVLLVPFDDTTASGLAESIDELNKAFAKLLVSDKFHRIYPFDSEYNPFYMIIENRKQTILNRAVEHNNYFVFYCHGHDPVKTSAINVYNLDNELGKGKPLVDKGELNFLVSLSRKTKKRKGDEIAEGSLLPQNKKIKVK